jgi:flagellar hook-basal body complex protein FliE
VIPAISAALGPLNPSEWSVGSISSDASALAGAGSAGSGSFSGALTSAIDSLQTSQTNATTAAGQLATGQATDPTAAVTAVENASLAMDLAAQIRTKLVDATNTIFQTQV